MKNQRKTSKYVFLLLAMFIVYSVKSQIFVNRLAALGGNGSSWGTAYNELQTALDAATISDTIWIAEGTYYPTEAPDSVTTTNPRKKAFHVTGKKIVVYGGFAGTETAINQRNIQIHPTILSGDFNNNDSVTGKGNTLSIVNNTENAYHVFVIVSASQATLDGVIITGGNANVNTNYNYGGSTIYSDYGGGMVAFYSPLIINNCTFSGNNVTSNGGGLVVGGSPFIMNSSTIINNNSGFDGAALSLGSTVTINTSTISDNKSGTNGGAISGATASLIVSINNSTISGNAGGWILSSGNFKIKSSIVWTAFSGSMVGPSVNVTSYGNNIFSSAPPLYLTTDKVYVTPAELNLQPLANNGGSTKTILPGTGSVAINNGNLSDLSAAQNRPIVGMRDIGAAENCNTFYLDSMISPSRIYTWRNGITYIRDTSGITYTVSGVSPLGCDSVYILYLKVLPRIYVDKDAVTGNNDGSSWANAYTNFQTALNSARTNDEIWVAEGVYKPTEAPDSAITADPRKKAFHAVNKNVTIYGGFDGTETILSQRIIQNHPTVFSGDFNDNDVITGGGYTSITGNTENAYHVFVLRDFQKLIVDGICVKGGKANNANSNIYDGIYSLSTSGAGIYATGSHALINIVNSTIIGNDAHSGGAGMFFSGDSINIVGSTIGFNIANNGGGGGVAVSNGFFTSIIIRTSTIVSNYGYNGGGVYSQNCCSSSIIHIINSTISNNAAWDGAAIYNVGIYSFSGSINLKGSIIWTPSTSPQSPASTTNIRNIGGVSYFTSSGYNIFFNAPTSAVTADLVNITAAQLNLQSLAYNGGPVQTRLPGMGSVAIDAGYPGDLSNAQNGPIASIRDIGAAEYGSPLPVELMYFSAIPKSDNVQVLWSTASEQNNRGFDIERSVDGSSFDVVNFVKGAGNSNRSINYTLTDEAAFAKANKKVLYYRLKQIDNDGRNTFSTIVRVENKSDEAKTVWVSPNPFTKDYLISINAIEDGASAIEMTDVQGKVVLAQHTIIFKGLNTVEVKDLSAIQSGIYFVKVTTNNETQILKVIKQ